MCEHLLNHGTHRDPGRPFIFHVARIAGLLSPILLACSNPALHSGETGEAANSGHIPGSSNTTEEPNDSTTTADGSATEGNTSTASSEATSSEDGSGSNAESNSEDGSPNFRVLYWPEVDDEATNASTPRETYLRSGELKGPSRVYKLPEGEYFRDQGSRLSPSRRHLSLSHVREGHGSAYMIFDTKKPWSSPLVLALTGDETPTNVGSGQYNGDETAFVFTATYQRENGGQSYWAQAVAMARFDGPVSPEPRLVTRIQPRSAHFVEVHHLGEKDGVPRITLRHSPETGAPDDLALSDARGPESYVTLTEFLPESGQGVQDIGPVDGRSEILPYIVDLYYEPEALFMFDISSEPPWGPEPLHPLDQQLWTLVRPTWAPTGQALLFALRDVPDYPRTALLLTTFRDRRPNAPLLLNPGDDVSAIQSVGFFPQGNRVHFSRETDEVWAEAVYVDIEGDTVSEPTRFLQPATPAHIVTEIRFGDLEQTVLFKSDLRPKDPSSYYSELHAYPVAAEFPVKPNPINHPLADQESVLDFEFRFTPTRQTIVYSTHTKVDEEESLYAMYYIAGSDDGFLPPRRLQFEGEFPRIDEVSPCGRYFSYAVWLTAEDEERDRDTLFVIDLDTPDQAPYPVSKAQHRAYHLSFLPPLTDDRGAR